MINAPQDAKAFYDNTMAEAPQAVRAFYTSLTKQDSGMLRSILDDGFTFKSPLAEFDTPEGFVAMVGQFGGWVESSRCIVDGDHVAHTFVYHMTAPGRAEIPMCEVFELRDGRILSSRAYNNPDDFPSPDADTAAAPGDAASPTASSYCLRPAKATP